MTVIEKYKVYPSRHYVGDTLPDTPETLTLHVAIDRSLMMTMSATITSMNVLINKATITNKTGRYSDIVKWYSSGCCCIKWMVKVPFFVQNPFPLCLMLIYDEMYKRA